MESEKVWNYQIVRGTAPQSDAIDETNDDARLKASQFLAIPSAIWLRRQAPFQNPLLREEKSSNWGLVNTDVNTVSFIEVSSRFVDMATACFF